MADSDYLKSQYDYFNPKNADTSSIIGKNEWNNYGTHAPQQSWESSTDYYNRINQK